MGQLDRTKSSDGRTDDGAAPLKFHKSKGATTKKRFPFANGGGGGGGVLTFPRVILADAGVGGGGGARVGNILKADGEEKKARAPILPTSPSIVASF